MASHPPAFDIPSYIDLQAQVLFNDVRHVTERRAMASLVLREYEMRRGDRTVGELLRHGATIKGKPLPPSWDATSHPWWTMMMKDIPPDLDLHGNVTADGLTALLATAPAEDQPWLRDIMLAGGTYMLRQMELTMIAALAE